jgi:Putative prokaryotic signal transducing protein
MELVRLTVLANPEEAELVRSLLDTEGIEALVKQTNYGAGTMNGYSGGEQEILVRTTDLEGAQALIAAQ